MKLKSVTINNYRSIEELSFDIAQLADKTFTYGLIGVNEAGKSTILKALALKDGLVDEKGNVLPLKKDFKDKSKPVEIDYDYLLEKDDLDECIQLLSSQATPIEIKASNLRDIMINVTFNSATPNQPEFKIDVVNITEENGNKTAIQDLIKQIILEKAHKAIFWTAEDRYLISQPVNLSQFATEPETTSIPLKKLLCACWNNRSTEDTRKNQSN